MLMKAFSSHLFYNGDIISVHIVYKHYGFSCLPSAWKSTNYVISVSKKRINIYTLLSNNFVRKLSARHQKYYNIFHVYILKLVHKMYMYKCLIVLREHIKYAHGFVVLCFTVVISSILRDLCTTFTKVHFTE